MLSETRLLRLLELCGDFASAIWGQIERGLVNVLLSYGLSSLGQAKVCRFNL